MIYLDNAATTSLDERVLEEMIPYLTSEYGNPGSLHPMGAEAKRAVDTARERVAAFLHARPHEIVFTSGGTESNNLAIRGIAEYLGKTGRREIVSDKTEHASVLSAIDAVCSHNKWLTSFLVAPNQVGSVPASAVESSVTSNTGLVSIMGVNNETGATNNIKEIGKMCRSNGIFFHTDCVQLAPFFHIDVRSIECDLMSISSHKLHGPKGVGALYVQSSVPMWPLISGSKTQEFGLRGGTLNVPGIVGFGKACELALEDMYVNTQKVLRVKYDFFDSLRYLLESFGIADILNINGNPPYEPGGIMNLRFNGVDSETLVLYLGSRGVCISTGSACHAQEQTPSAVLTSMGLSPEQAFSSVRISFSHTTTHNEAVSAAEIIANAVRDLTINTCCDL